MASKSKAIICALSLLLAALPPLHAQAAPRHDICADVGDSFAFGVSSYGSLRQWAPEAKEQYGADFRFLYVYILNGGMDDPDNFEEWYVRPFAEAAQEMGAIPVYTFYQLLDIGRAAGFGGSEAEVVEQTLTDSSAMRTYFDNFVWLLEIARDVEPPVIVHVEPDSWGFMMWAMGVEGNDDATSVPVQVAASGHPDLGGFPNHAGGLGQALLALRDRYAPAVRLGWHASNFRVGTRPEVVTSFYSEMGDWDVLFGEHPHVEAEGADWWEEWDSERLDTNLNWLSTVVEGAGVPLVFWQMPIGASDWHLLGDLSDLSMLQRFVSAGAVGLLFEQIAHQGEADPDDIRAAGAMGTTPPAGHPAGGTAADVRERVAAYSQSPLLWPEGTICDSPIATSGSEGTGGIGGESGSPPSGGDDGAGTDDSDGGCGCVVASRRSHHGICWALLGLLAAVVRRRARCRRARAAPRTLWVRVGW